MKKTLPIIIIVFLLILTTTTAEWCYQESANVSTACGGLATGNYEKGHGVIGEYGTIYINYTIPKGTENANLKIKYTSLSGITTENLTILEGCIKNKQNLEIQIDSKSYNTAKGTPFLNVSCLNTSKTNLLYQTGGNNLAAIPRQNFTTDGIWDTGCEFYRPSSNWHGYTDCTSIGSTSVSGIYEEAIWWYINLPPNQIIELTNVSTNSSTINISFNYTDTATENTKIYLNGVYKQNVTYPTNHSLITGLTPQTQYNITVKAYNSTGTNETINASNSILVTTTALDTSTTNNITTIGSNTKVMIQDLNQSWTLENPTDTEIDGVLQTALTGKVKIFMNNKTTTGNYTQYYQYINNGTTVNDNITLLTGTLQQVYFRVFDSGRSPQPNIKIRISQSNSSINQTYQLTQQVLTDEDGYAETYIQNDRTTRITATRISDGTTTTFTNLIVNERLRTDPYYIYLGFTGVTDETLVTSAPGYITNKTQNIIFSALTEQYETITYNTDYRESLGIGNKTAITQATGDQNLYIPQGLHQMELTADEDFDSSSTDNITVKIYANNIKIAEHLIVYIGTTDTDLLNINDKGLNKKTSFILLLIAIIILSITIQYTFGIQSEGIGIHTYYALIILCCFINTYFIWLGAYVGTYYTIQLIKKIIGII